ncbi:MAG: MATE family efflux transporter [Candidatus Methanoplasma sp.]|jgi:putative MATE family efflux protein|nr:MATE family efflux transporter [Candidatus Methanoplasma sp.]
MEEYDKTKDVETLLGDPKKAILAMAIPISIAMIAQSANNLIDAMWVAGLGTDALAAVGIVFPLFFIVIGISNGIGVGAASAISKRIGAGMKSEADNTASHSIVLILIASAIMTVALIIFLEPFLRAMGTGAAESTIQECINYAMPMSLFTFVFMIVGVLSSILRSEGSAKRSMYILILAAVINMVLDPFFIYDYGLGWGMAGAAIATVLATAVSMVIIFYWYFIKKDLFLKFRFKGFKFDPVIIKDIFKVGLPASVQMIILSVVSIFMNLIILQVGGDDGVAIYSSDWRVINVLAIPLMGIATGLVPVCAAAYGARRYDKIKTAYTYSIKISVLSMVLISAVTAVFAPQILTVFTYDPSTEYLNAGLTEFMRIACVFLPFMALGMVAESLFQALGMGVKSLLSSIFRNFLMLPVCYFAIMVTSDLTVIWWGLTVSEIVSALIVAAWSFMIIKVILKEFKIENGIPE